MIYTFKVLKCINLPEKMISVQNCNGLGIIKIYSTYKVEIYVISFSFDIVQDSHIT